MAVLGINPLKKRAESLLFLSWNPSKTRMNMIKPDDI